MFQRRPIESPCVSVCVMDDATGWCQGCFRTIGEIGRWSSLTDEERARVIALLPGRRDAAERGAVKTDPAA